MTLPVPQATPQALPRAIPQAQPQTLEATPASEIAVPERTATPPRVDRSPARRAAVAPAPTPLWGLGFDGRINRLQWLTGVVMLALVLVVVQVVALKHPDPSWVHGHRLAFGVALVLMLRLATLRFHDRDRTGWWSLALLVPGLNLVALVELLCLRGVDETTRHGPAPDDGSVFELLFGSVLLGVFVGLGLASFHPTHAVEAFQSPAQRQAVMPYGSAHAKQVFEANYRDAAYPKAYAATGRGAFGWSVTAASASEAITHALASCESRRRWRESMCVLVDVNDQPVVSSEPR